MKTFIVSIKIFVVLFILTVAASNAFAQGKPVPVKSETVDMLLGTWVVSPYEMMGSTWSGEANHYWKHNGQYMFIDINEKDNNGQTWAGTIVIIPSADGSFTGYGFDEWGGVSTITGKANGNKLTATSTSQWGTSTRDIEINGNSMTHKMTFTMKDKDGKDMVQNLTLNYTKK